MAVGDSGTSVFVPLVAMHRAMDELFKLISMSRAMLFSSILFQEPFVGRINTIPYAANISWSFGHEIANYDLMDFGDHWLV